MLLGLYETKDMLRHSVGQPLHYQETQILICEYRANGVVAVRGGSPDRKPWTAEVTLIDGHIVHVE